LAIQLPWAQLLLARVVFQRHYLIYRNVEGGLLYILCTTYSKNCSPLNFHQEYIKSVFSHDLYVIALFQSNLLSGDRLS